MRVESEKGRGKAMAREGSKEWPEVVAHGKGQGNRKVWGPVRGENSYPQELRHRQPLRQE